jgi:transposase InsO family protein
MTTQIYRKLNLLNYSPENLKIVKEYLSNGHIPPEFHEKKVERFIDHYKDFILKGNNIIYTPLNLLVVPDDKREDILKEIYNDPNQGIGLGIQSFYNKINSKYLNIRRKDVKDFLVNQSIYQINKPEPRPVNKPIVAKYPNHRLAIDLVDMTKYEGYNNHYKWILTAIDYFSKKVFAVPLKNKEDNTCLEGLKKIIHEQMNNTYPKMLQSDNGGEFKNELFEKWGKDHNVKLIHTMSYTPTGNALIENFNKFLRKYINEGMTRYNSFNWVDHLNEYLNNRNDSKHSITKKKPNDIWVPGHYLKDYENDEDIKEVRTKLIEKAKRDVKKVEASKFNKGDYVRASMTSLYSEQRKIEKAGAGKLLPVKFSPEIYIVESVIKPKENPEFANDEYTLKTLKGVLLKKETKSNDKKGLVHEPQRFFASDLQGVQRNQETIISQHQGLKLNKLGTDAFNEDELEAIELKKNQNNENAKTKRIINKEKEAKEKEQYEQNPRKSERSNKGQNSKLYVDFERD